MLFVIIPLIVLFFFGSVAVAIALLPQAYDWRTMSISQLLYPKVNPQFHFVPAIGIAVAGVLVLPFGGYVKRQLDPDSPVVRAGAAVFTGGAICLILASLINSHPLHGRATLPKLHEVLGRVAGIGLGAGIVLFEIYALRQRQRIGAHPSIRRLAFWWGLMTGAAVTMLILRLLIAAHLRMLDSFTQTLKHSSAWHLGFWEWIGATAVIAFLFLSASLLPDRAS